jgi:hypothetical protein
MITRNAPEFGEIPELRCGWQPPGEPRVMTTLANDGACPDRGELAPFPVGRRRRVFQFVLARHFVSAAELDERFDVSLIVIRRDLRALVEQ